MISTSPPVRRLGCCRPALRVFAFENTRDGVLRLEDLVPLLTPKTRLMTLSLMNFFNGFHFSLAICGSSFTATTPETTSPLGCMN